MSLHKWSWVGLEMQIPPIQPGIIALHSNRTESLAEAAIAWLQQNPLRPLEEEVILVQSNAMAEWVKMVLAEQGGVCAATRIELPARFIWRTYRQVLGRHAVPAQSALDKLPLTWRLMALLPHLLDDPAFAPVASFLRPDAATRLYPLASRLADLFDQYQVYRSDWLDLWAAGRDVLSHASYASLVPVPDEQLWQPKLWRAVFAQLTEREHEAGRARLHQRVLDQLRRGEATSQPVARRVVAFGMTQLPQSVLQMLAALAGRSQVLLAIPNPCRFHWGDIMDGRQLHHQIRRHWPLRNGQDLSVLPLEALHAHAHPLLAAWGRQGRDFVRQTDAFDDEQQALAFSPVVRVDLFEEVPATDGTLLQQVQAHIRDLVPLSEHPDVTLAADDQSIVFHSAHSLVREMEVLQDHLLDLLAKPEPGNALQPRDIVVMLPTIEVAAPAIRAVFGQYRVGDARYIPFDIADLGTKATSPLIHALEWLLHLSSERCEQSQLRDFLSQPSVAARFGLDVEALPRLLQWLDGAGVRWGVDASHRQTLGLHHCGQTNTSLFGLHRMLMGYAIGQVPHADTPRFAGIEPYAEVGGLDAELAGGFAHLLDKLQNWLAQSPCELTPAAWAVQFRTLMTDFFLARVTDDQNSLAALELALQNWLAACELAQFDQPVALDAARSAWLDALDSPELAKRFRAGGLTFCSMMPMRAIPFQVVCLLGMNEQDYPRRAHRSDFDLMGLPGQFRAGDRARRDDDRQLMLEALLSARRQLYLSWSGRSVRDNTEQPPSVLIAQLRDYLRAGWHSEVLAERTTEHPLQAFSRRYFEQGSGLLTYAKEWRGAHLTPETNELQPALTASPALDAPTSLNCERLQQFLRNPVRAYFRNQLGVVFDAIAPGDNNDELFDLTRLDRFQAVRQLLDDSLLDLQARRALGQTVAPAELSAMLQQALGKMARAGQLPMAGVGRRAQAQLQQVLVAMLTEWQALVQDLSLVTDRQHLRFTHAGTVLEDWVGPLYRLREATPALPQMQWVGLVPMALTEPGKPDKPRASMLLQPWLMSLLASAAGHPIATRLMGLDATLLGQPIEPQVASRHLQILLDLWEAGSAEPLPLPFKTAWAYCQDVQLGRKAYEGDYNKPGEGQEPCLHRVFPDFESLVSDGRFAVLACQLIPALQEWSDQSVSVIAHATSQVTEDALSGQETL